MERKRERRKFLGEETLKCVFSELVCGGAREAGAARELDEEGVGEAMLAGEREERVRRWKGERKACRGVFATFGIGDTGGVGRGEGGLRWGLRLSWVE